MLSVGGMYMDRGVLDKDIGIGWEGLGFESGRVFFRYLLVVLFVCERGRFRCFGSSFTCGRFFGSLFA